MDHAQGHDQRNMAKEVNGEKFGQDASIYQPNRAPATALPQHSNLQNHIYPHYYPPQTVPQGFYPGSYTVTRPYGGDRTISAYHHTFRRDDETIARAGLGDTDENNIVKGFCFSDQKTRKLFLQKMFGILTCQFLVNAIAVIVVPTTIYAFFITVGPPAVFVCLLFMIRLDGCRRRAPMNYIFLVAVTAAEICTHCFSFAIEFCGPWIFVPVLAMAAVFLALALYLFQNKWDLNMKSAAIIIFVIGYILPIAVGVPFVGRWLLVTSLVPLVVSLLIVYDALLMTGPTSTSVSPQEYAYAALKFYLYIDPVFIGLGIIRMLIVKIHKLFN